MLTFAIIGAIGLVGLLVSLTVGELLDAFDVHDLGISSTTVFAFMTTFGAAGLLAGAAGWPTVAAIVTALITGAIVGVIAQKVIDNLAATTDGHADLNAVGLYGMTTTTVSPQGGEVRLEGAQELEARLAWADTVIDANTRIHVVEQSGSRVRVTAA